MLHYLKRQYMTMVSTSPKKEMAQPMKDRRVKVLA